MNFDGMTIVEIAENHVTENGFVEAGRECKPASRRKPEPWRRQANRRRRFSSGGASIDMAIYWGCAASNRRPPPVLRKTLRNQGPKQALGGAENLLRTFFALIASGRGI